MPIRRVAIALLFAAALFAAQPRPPKRAKTHRGSASRIVEAPSFDAVAVNNPAQPDVHFGEKGSAVLRAQILLDRAHFSCGEIDGEFGTNLAKTLAAFLQARSLPATPQIDASVWQVLNADQAPAVQQYTISADDVKGPFAPVPRDMSDQAKLPALGYASPVEALGERFHAAPSALSALNPGADFSQAGQQIVVPNVMTMPPEPAARVEVSKSESSVRAYDQDGRLLAFYVATIGSRHDPLPVGEWKIRGVRRNPTFHYNPDLFWDAKPDDTRAVIQPGPNNPVGVVWIDLSKDHYGIHGTPEPKQVGHTLSHGCIRLTNWDAAELASMVKPGVPALLKE